MNFIEEWNYLVSEYKRNFGEQEDKVQTLWESYLSNPFMFGYSGNGELEAKRMLHIGSIGREIPDLILRKADEDVCIIELKRYALPKSEDFEKQLLNYMVHTDLRLSVGVLVCNALYIYWYDHATAKKECLEIPFEMDNEDGIKFVELFSKNNFDQEKIRLFILEAGKSKENIAAIKAEITDSLVKELLRVHFSEKYTTEDFEAAVADMEISVQSRNKAISMGNNLYQGNTSVVFSRDSKQTVLINGTELPLYRGQGQSVQDFVKQTLETLFAKKLLSPAEISRLQDKSYCQRTFELQHPLLQKEWKDCFDNKGHPRYWGDSPSKKIGGYYVCSQWWKAKFDIYENKIADWLRFLERSS